MSHANNKIIAYLGDLQRRYVSHLQHTSQPLWELSMEQGYRPEIDTPRFVEMVLNDAGLAINVCLELESPSALDSGQPINLVRELIPRGQGTLSCLSGLQDTADFAVGEEYNAFLGAVTAAARAVSTRVPPIWSDTAYLMFLHAMLPAVIVIDRAAEALGPARGESGEDIPELTYVSQFGDIDAQLMRDHGFSLADLGEYLSGLYNLPRSNNPLFPAEIRSAVLTARDELRSQFASEHNRIKPASASASD